MFQADYLKLCMYVLRRDMSSALLVLGTAILCPPVHEAFARDLRPIAQVGDLVPLPESNPPEQPYVPVRSFVSASLLHPTPSEQGDVVIEGIVNGAALGLSQTQRAYWIRRVDGSLEPLARTDMPAPATSAGTLTDIGFFAFTPSGRVTFEATLNNNSSWWCKAGNLVRPLIREGQVITTSNGPTTLTNLSQPYLSLRQPFDTVDGGCGMFFLSTIIENGTTHTSAILRATSEGVSVISRGTDTPILPEDATALLLSLQFADSNRRGEMLIGVSLQGNYISSANNRALLLIRRDGTLETIARKGSPAQDQSYGGIIDFTWDSAGATPQLNNNGAILFQARFLSAANRPFSAFWSNRSGAGEMIFKEQDPIHIDGSDLSPSLVSARQYSFADDGAVAFWGTTSQTPGGAFIVNRGDGLHLVAAEGAHVAGEADDYKIVSNAFDPDSFGLIRGASYVTNLVNGRSEFAIQTSAGTPGNQERVVLSTLSPLHPIVLRQGRPFTPEGDVILSWSTLSPMQMNQRGDLTILASVQRSGSTVSRAQSLVTISGQGYSDLAFATGDTICLAPGNCPTLASSYVPMPLNSDERFISSIDTTSDMIPDSGRMYATLNFGTSSAIVSARTGCRADINESGLVTVQDIFDFLTRYFLGLGDINGQSNTSVQDIFSFLTAYFEGC